MDAGKRIKELRIKCGLSQTELANKIDITKQLLYKYENGIITNIPSDKIELLAKELYSSPAYIMGWEKENTTKIKPKGIKIPVLGEVAAGVPIDAVEDILDYEEIPISLAETGEFFGLRIKGDSMAPRIIEGDVVIVRQQSDADSGDVVIVLINGDSATCKKLMKYDGGISLISFNPIYDPMNFSKKEIVEKPVVIIGKVIENRQKY